MRWLALGLCVLTLLMWLPALTTPWWGDDYFFLQIAHKARLNHEPWWQAFWPEVRTGFWRPLSIDLYWRIIEDEFCTTPLIAHAVNFLLWLLASVSVGLTAHLFARQLKWSSPWVIGALTAGIYGVNDVHFLPLHWASTANSSILVLWTALCFCCWIAAPSCTTKWRWVLCALIPLLQLLALFSKESSILIPLLLLCFSVFLMDTIKLGRQEIIAWLSCTLVCGIWYCFFKHFTGSRDQAYSLVIGTNILRNLFALSAWLLNIPREALRMIMTGEILWGCIWAAAAAMPMLGFIVLSLLPLRKKLSPQKILAIVAFILLAYAPYFFLASQSYEYYAAVAIIFPLIILARGLSISTRPFIAIGLLCLSTFVSIHISRLVDYPSLIGRAHWAEKQFSYLTSQPIELPLVVQVNNAHQFYAISVPGLAWRLGIKESDVVLSDTCPANTRKHLVQNAQGDFQWQDCR